MARAFITLISALVLLPGCGKKDKGGKKGGAGGTTLGKPTCELLLKTMKKCNTGKVKVDFVGPKYRAACQLGMETLPRLKRHVNECSTKSSCEALSTCTKDPDVNRIMWKTLLSWLKMKRLDDANKGKKSLLKGERFDLCAEVDEHESKDARPFYTRLCAHWVRTSWPQIAAAAKAMIKSDTKTTLPVFFVTVAALGGKKKEAEALVPAK